MCTHHPSQGHVCDRYEQHVGEKKDSFKPRSAACSGLSLYQVHAMAPCCQTAGSPAAACPPGEAQARVSDSPHAVGSGGQEQLNPADLAETEQYCQSIAGGASPGKGHRPGLLQRQVGKCQCRSGCIAGDSAEELGALGNKAWRDGARCPTSCPEPPGAPGPVPDTTGG